jgi:hypothetical protein
MAIDLRKVKFFVEGEGDQVFLRDILKIWYGLELTKAELTSVIIICGGYGGINKQLDEFKDTNDGKKREGGKNIVIFDADYSGRDEHHGFKQKIAYLEIKKMNIELISVHFFFLTTPMTVH